MVDGESEEAERDACAWLGRPLAARLDGWIERAGRRVCPTVREGRIMVVRSVRGPRVDLSAPGREMTEQLNRRVKVLSNITRPDAQRRRGQSIEAREET